MTYPMQNEKLTPRSLASVLTSRFTALAEGAGEPAGMEETPCNEAGEYRRNGEYATITYSTPWGERSITEVEALVETARVLADNFGDGELKLADPQGALLAVGLLARLLGQALPEGTPGRLGFLGACQDLLAQAATVPARKEG